MQASKTKDERGEVTAAQAEGKNGAGVKRGRAALEDRPITATTY